MKKYYSGIAIVLLLLILVLVKSLSSGHFRNDASKWAHPSVNQNNLITPEQMNKLAGNILVVNLDTEKNLAGMGKTVNIPAESVLEKVNWKKLHAHKGNTILVSDDTALSARMWMLLSQMGLKKLYILTDSADNEVLKYKFRPDTVARPEL